VEVASRAPARQIGTSAGEINVGSSVDMILFDPSQMTQVMHHHSLYKNETLQGKVIMALCRGEVTRF
jgi:dihydroorotase-like cyclic amidohydrolase